MSYIYPRIIEPYLLSALERGKSILLLGPRQAGKSTLIATCVAADINYTFLEGKVRQRFEVDPDGLQKEILAHRALNPQKRNLVVYIDEVQRVPGIIDCIQHCIDQGIAQFVLTGSSAHKLKHHKTDINLLPGRVLSYTLDALSVLELDAGIPDIEGLLLNGTLPEVAQQITLDYKEELLTSYVEIYLEQEVRAEALVRDLGSFSQFLRLAAIEAGNPINFSDISQNIGVTRNTIYQYFQVLEDCLIISRIDPITEHTGRRRLSHASKYLFFDLGVRRIAASEGLKLPEKYYGSLFEQFVGIELLKVMRTYAAQAKLRYWHDHGGPEVDYVIEYSRSYLPIEVKWTENPTLKDAKHLMKFMQEYECYLPAIIVCRAPQAIQITDSILALPWQDLPLYVKRFLLS